ncbi:6-phosphogluconate dehydrogenase [Nematocida major]|uniref:6-phosphogluconate dehydrogenase n=1 Tax=Nematocida major TaxID=1912982 RepID=UPI0020077284|nr:6-phosphogluconate dehydrogenase [Nematocida major]KAH9387159.1 6-phosphogluconate dehydrogenase [Nematocida major]
MDIGLIGLGVMGENLVMNAVSKGYTVCVYNRTVEKTRKFVGEANTPSITAGETLPEFVSALKAPRKILLMVKAGAPVDEFLRKLSEHLSPDDIVIDGGNSNYKDTTERCRFANGKFLYVGCGISGGEDGARYGPSIMPGGDRAAWEHIQGILQGISARAEGGGPCCEWIGPEGSGHLVKTVHNGIEYAEMQVISDFYQILRARMEPCEVSAVFKKWQESGTSGFLIESAVQVLEKKSEEKFIIDSIVDASAQKGTGKWTVQEAFEFGVPASVISDAVMARAISSMKGERAELAQKLPAGTSQEADFSEISAEEMRKAFLVCRAVSYIQGFNLIRAISEHNKWDISLKTLCSVWSNGCIIRSEFLGTLAAISESSLLFASSEFLSIARDGIAQLRKIVALSVQGGVSIPCISSVLSHYDAMRAEKSSGNMIQALRDLFGAHTLLLEESPETPVHINWK